MTEESETCSWGFLKEAPKYLSSGSSASSSQTAETAGQVLYDQDRSCLPAADLHKRYYPSSYLLQCQQEGTWSSEHCNVCNVFKCRLCRHITADFAQEEENWKDVRCNQAQRDHKPEGRVRRSNYHPCMGSLRLISRLPWSARNCIPLYSFLIADCRTQDHLVQA